MEIQDKENATTLELFKKIKHFFPDIDDILGLFATLLGAADNVSQYILEKERGNYLNIPHQCRYGLLQIYQILSLISKILRDEVESTKIGGYMPAGKSAWKNEKDFEKRFILLIKLFYKHLRDEGKI